MLGVYRSQKTLMISLFASSLPFCSCITKFAVQPKQQRCTMNGNARTVSYVISYSNGPYTSARSGKIDKYTVAAKIAELRCDWVANEQFAAV